MTIDATKAILYIHWIRAESLRRSMDMTNIDYIDIDWTDAYTFDMSHAHLAMETVWMALMYVIIDGWKEHGFHDPDVDAAISAIGDLKTLRRYRNSVFHVFKDPLDPRHRMPDHSNKFDKLMALNKAIANFFPRNETAFINIYDNNGSISMTASMGEMPKPKRRTTRIYKDVDALERHGPSDEA